MGRCKRPTIQPGDGLESWTPILFDGADDDDLLLLNDAVYVSFDIDDVRPRWHLAAILVFAIPEESPSVDTSSPTRISLTRVPSTSNSQRFTSPDLAGTESRMVRPLTNRLGSASSFSCCATCMRFRLLIAAGVPPATNERSHVGRPAPVESARSQEKPDLFREE